MKSIVNGKPKILFVGPTLGMNPGFIPSPVESLMPALQKAGYDCKSTSSNPHRFQRVLDMLWSIFRTCKWADIINLQIHSHRSFIVEDFLSWLIKRMGKRLVMVLHSGSFPGFIKRFPRWTKRVLERADEIITPSAYLKESVEGLGYSAKIIPNLILIEKYKFLHRRSASPSILWMRSFFHYYNPKLAVDTLKILMQKYPNVMLTMAGKDKGLESPIREYSFDLGLSDHIRFPGFLTMDMKCQEFSHHDIYINTNSIENFGISIVEAGAFGLPIVATNVGGIPYLFTNEVNALLVPSNEPMAMASAIMRVIEEPGLASKLSMGGRKLAESCAPEIVIPLWDQVFNDLR